ncbi:MAG: IS66 family transposase [Dehalococcoidia bacterium]
MRIETETDIERLRQMALLQQAELDRLHRRLVELTQELARAKGTDTDTLQLEIELLKEQLDNRTRELFASTSEKRSANGKADKGSQPRHGHGPTEQLSLPIVEVIHPLDDADKICPKCGGELLEWNDQFEEAEEIDVVERSFRLIRHKRQKYRCQCGECIETALGPPKLIPGGRYSVDFAVSVAVAKYADHLPLARQARQMARAGLEIGTQALWDQINALAAHLEPTHDALHDRVLGASVIAADETRWPLLGKPGSSKWHAWAVCSKDSIAYRILPSRSADAGSLVLRDYTGTVVADGYTAYTTLQERAGPAPFDLANCWIHCRRKFVKAEPHYPQAAEVLEKIGELYKIEAEVRPTDAEWCHKLSKLRRTKSAPIVKDIHKWLKSQRALPKSSLGNAIGYMLGLWPGLEKFLDNPDIPMDTNQVERGMRALALGRKNHYGSRSHRGTRVAALFYSLIESAKLTGVEPSAYLAEATRRAIANPGTATLPTDIRPN